MAGISELTDPDLYLKVNVGDDAALQAILQEVVTEHKRALAKWGTEFDEKNTPNDWAHYINYYASTAAPLEFQGELFEANMLKVAGLALSALKQYRGNGLSPRHYDGEDRL